MGKKETRRRPEREQHAKFFSYFSWRFKKIRLGGLRGSRVFFCFFLNKVAKGNDREVEGVEECDWIRAGGQKEERSRAAIGPLAQFALLTPQSVSGSAPTAGCMSACAHKQALCWFGGQRSSSFETKGTLFSSRIIKFWTSFVVVVVFRPNKCLRCRSGM